jgi:hypothetical protein
MKVSTKFREYNKIHPFLVLASLLRKTEMA